MLLLMTQLTAQTRRTIYQLTNKSPLSDDQLKTLVEEAVKHAPTSFNMQQSRAVLVTGDMHHRVWDSVIENYTKSFKDDGESTLSSSTRLKGSHRLKREGWMDAKPCLRQELLETLINCEGED
jgi:predicted oxidoreductase (fatty acid repression mutant protein)